jgi:hypothetical protein
MKARRALMRLIWMCERAGSRDSVSEKPPRIEGSRLWAGRLAIEMRRQVKRQVVSDDQPAAIPRGAQEDILDELLACPHNQAFGGGVDVQRLDLCLRERSGLVEETLVVQPGAATQLIGANAQSLAGVQSRLGIEGQRPRRRAEVVTTSTARLASFAVHSAGAHCDEHLRGFRRAHLAPIPGRSTTPAPSPFRVHRQATLGTRDPADAAIEDQREHLKPPADRRGCPEQWTAVGISQRSLWPLRLHG